MLFTLLGKNSSWNLSGQAQGFYKDTATHMDDFAAANTGFVKRKALITAEAGSAPTICEVTMRPYLGAFQLHRLIPNRTEIRLELHRAKDAFSLIHNDVLGAAIKLESVNWHLRRVELSDNITKQIDKALNLPDARHILYPIARYSVYTKSFLSRSIDFTNVLPGPIPTHIVIGFVSGRRSKALISSTPSIFKILG